MAASDRLTKLWGCGLCRDYDFTAVIQWFAERADMIIVMFDAHKLDISDELKTVLDTIKPHQEKIRILLNKADTINSQQLMRVRTAAARLSSRLLSWALITNCIVRRMR